MFDTLKLTKALEGNGLNRTQAETIVSGLYEALNEHSGGLASKDDLTTLEANMRSEIRSVAESCEKTINGQTKWLFGLIVAVGGAILAAVKLLQA